MFVIRCTKEINAFEHLKNINDGSIYLAKARLGRPSERIERDIRATSPPSEQIERDIRKTSPPRGRDGQPVDSRWEKEVARENERGRERMARNI